MSNSYLSNDKFNALVDILIRVAFLLAIVGWCFNILTPFTGVILWGVILALAMYPLHRTLSRRLKGRNKLASTILVILGLIAIIVPTWLFVGGIIESLTDLGNDFNEGTLKLPPPNPAIAEWPVIGTDIDRLWNEASTSLEKFSANHKEQLLSLGESLLSAVKSVGGSLFTMILAVVVAGTLLSSGGAQNTGRRFFYRLVGDKGDELIQLISGTVSSVVRGVIGVAIIQAFLVGIGCLLAGIPYAGVWTLVALILAILQLPLIPLSIVIIIWLFNEMSTVPAVLWTIYFAVVGGIDTPLKAIFLGKGASVPMIVIFLGVMGGFIASGFIGLFTGAIVVSVGYTLFITWLNDGEAPPFETEQEAITTEPETE